MTRRGAAGTVVALLLLGACEDFWGIRLREDEGADGRGAGAPMDVRIEGNHLDGAANGIRVDAGRDIILRDSETSGVRGDEERLAVETSFLR